MLSPMAYVISPMPYATGQAEIPYSPPGDGGASDGKKSKKKKNAKKENETGRAMTAMDWKMMAHAISHAKGIKELPIIGGFAQMDGAAAPPRQDSGKIHIVSLFPNPGDMESFTGKIASKMSEVRPPPASIALPRARLAPACTASRTSFSLFSFLFSFLFTSHAKPTIQMLSVVGDAVGEREDPASGSN